MECLEQIENLEKINPPEKPLLIGICGGSASGKTTGSYFIVNCLGEENCLLFSLDNYYFGPNDEERKHIENYNFDRPEALDMDLAYTHLCALIRNESIDMPVYSFNVSKRMPYTQKVYPKKVIIFEGIFSFHEKRIRDLMDLKLFFDLDSDTRLARRITRDIADRSRVLDTVMERYLTFVKPAFNLYIKPTRKYADLALPQSLSSSLALEIVCNHLKKIVLQKKDPIDEEEDQREIEPNLKRTSSSPDEYLQKNEFFADDNIEKLFSIEKNDSKQTQFYNKILLYLIKKKKPYYYKLFIEKIMDKLLELQKKANKEEFPLLFFDETGNPLSQPSEKNTPNSTPLSTTTNLSPDNVIKSIFFPFLLKLKDEQKVSQLLQKLKNEDGEEKERRKVTFHIISVYLSKEAFDKMKEISKNVECDLTFVTIYFGDTLLKFENELEIGGFLENKHGAIAINPSYEFLSKNNFIKGYRLKIIQNILGDI